MATVKKKKDRTLGRGKELSKSSTDFLKIDDGESKVIRVIVDAFEDALVHRTPVEGKNGRYHADVACLDQEDKGNKCPGCKDDLQRRYKFWVPVIVRDDDGDEKKDKVMIWSSGITIQRRLEKMHAKRGLGNRDIEVEREGSTKDNTTYDIDWADEENTALSDNDEKLIKKLPDVSRYAKIPSPEDFYKAPGDRGQEPDEEIGRKSLNRDAFGAKKRKKESGGTEGTRRRVGRRTSKGKNSSKGKNKVSVRRRS